MAWHSALPAALIINKRIIVPVFSGLKLTISLSGSQREERVLLLFVLFSRDFIISKANHTTQVHKIHLGLRKPLADLLLLSITEHLQTLSSLKAS